MNMRRSITRGILAVLLAVVAIPTAAADASPTPTASPLPNAASHSARTVKIPFHHAGLEGSGVDCIGNGASCVGELVGSKGKVYVTNNTDRYWKFKLTCEFGGDKYSGENSPSSKTVTSEQSCNFNARAQYWNVVVVYKP